MYNATTASARAAALSSSKGGVGFLVDARERHVRADSDFDDFAHVPPHRDTADRDRDQERDHDLDDPKTSDPASSTSDASRVTRIVVKRRVIRGSSVMRPATEADIDQFLQVERHREMVSCPATAINIPPLVTDARPMHFDDLYNADRETCSYCSSNLPAKKAMSKRGVRRVSSLLSRHLGLDGDSEHTLDVSEMAAMDEYKAVALFLREIRRYRKEMFLSVQDRPFDRPTEKSTNYTKRKEAKKGKERRYARDMERVQVIMSQRRSLSADDPALMRAILRQERLLSTHSAKRKGKVDRETSEGVTPVKSFDNVKDDYETQYALERSQSELVPKRTSKSVEGDEAWKRVVSRLGIDGLTKSVRQKTGLDDGRKSDRSVAKRLVTENEEDDDYTLNPLRILTAIEPVDPAGAFEDSDARRGTSYHVGMDEPGVAGSRRRGLHRGIGGAEPGLLRRLRSFRRREQRA